MWFKSHPRNHSKTARPIGRAVFAFSGAEAGLGSTYTGETKGGARSASLSQADERLPAQFPCPRPKRRGFTGGTWFRPSDRARPALRCRNGVSAETPAIEKGSCQGRQALTEGLWVSYRNGLSVTGRLLLHRACNPSASHPLSTSPYTREARDGRRWPAPHRFAGLTRGGRRSLAPHRFEGAVGKARSPSFFVSVPRPKEAGLRAEHRGDLLTGG